MTKPYLYIDNDIEGNDVWWLPNNNDPIKDSGPRNLLPMDVACLASGTSMQSSGSEITTIGHQEPPVASSTGGLADSAIFRNVFAAEWTGTGTSEQVTHDSDFTRVQNGDNLGVGAWVYLESAAAVDIGVQWQGFDSTGGFTEASGFGTPTTVQPETWTYVFNSGTVANASTINAAVSVEANGTQSVGDKIYVGALFLGIDPSEWVFPTTPPASGIDFRFRAKILGDGTLFSNRTAIPAGNNGDSWHIEAANQGFHVRYGSRAGNDTVTTRTYTTATNIYEYDEWYDFRWRANLDGTVSFSILEDAEYGDWTVIDSGNVASLPDGHFNTARGIDTLQPGLTVGNSHMILDSFGMFDPSEEIGWLETEAGVSRTGSEISFTQDGTLVDHNHSLYLNSSGWIINADGVNLGGLELPYRSELKYGTGDYTIVQCFRAVASQDFRPTYDDWATSTGVKVRVDDADTFGVLSGPETLTFPSNPFDGTFRQFLVERESGVQVRGFIDDFTAPVATVSDSGTDISNTEPLKLGHDVTATSSSYLSGLIGVTITFDRLLEDYEKDDLFYWIQSGYPSENEPAWLRTEAVLYLNPNDPVQRAEYASRDRLINLAVDVPDEIYVRYDLTSSDGVSNPVLSHNDVRFANLRQYLHDNGYGHDDNVVPLLPIGHGQQPLVARSGQSSIPLELLGADWLNNDWTINFWAKLRQDGQASDMIFQDGVPVMSIRDRTDNTVALYFNSAGILVSSSPSTAHKQYSMVTVRRSGNNFELFINGVSDDTAVSADTVTPTQALTCRPATGGVIGPLHIWQSALTDDEITALYGLSTDEDVVVFNDTVNLSTGFSSQSLNWERR